MILSRLVKFGVDILDLTCDMLFFKHKPPLSNLTVVVICGFTPD